LFQSVPAKKYGTAKAVTFKKAPFFLFLVDGCGCAAKLWFLAQNEVFKFYFELNSFGILREYFNHKRHIFRAYQQKIWHGEAVTFKKPPFFCFSRAVAAAPQGFGFRLIMKCLRLKFPVSN